MRSNQSTTNSEFGIWKSQIGAAAARVPMVLIPVSDILERAERLAGGKSCQRLIILHMDAQKRRCRRCAGAAACYLFK
jgi:hypothetical protein